MENKSVIKFAPYLASFFCFAAGVAILTPMVIEGKYDSLLVSFGLYFIGKSFFVGPALFSIMQKNSNQNS